MSNKIVEYIVAFFQLISVGKINTGLTFQRKRYFSTVLGGLISLFGLIFLLVMIITALYDTFSRKYIYSEVDQGSFSFDGLQSLHTLINRIDLMAEVTTTDSEFCDTQ